MSTTAPVTVTVEVSTQEVSTAAPTAPNAAPFTFDAANVTQGFTQVTALNTYTTDLATLANEVWGYLAQQVSTTATPVAEAHVEVRITDDSVPANVPGVIPPKDVYDITFGPAELGTVSGILTNLNAAVAAARAFTGF